MGVKFLGQYLIEQGIITGEQLLDALKEQDDARIGSLAVAKGILLVSELEEILQQQRHIDARVGDIAVRNNMMTEEQRDYLLSIHRSDRRKLGEVLVKKRYITIDTLARAISSFEAEQAGMNVDPQFLPPRHKGRSDMVAMIGMTQKVLMRVASIPAKIEAAVEYSGPSAPCAFNSQIGLQGDYGGRYIICCDHQLGYVLSHRMVGTAEGRLTDGELRDALSEFANCVVGAAASALASLGHVVNLTPPQPLWQGVSSEPINDGARWHVHTPFGVIVALME